MTNAGQELMDQVDSRRVSYGRIMYYGTYDSRDTGLRVGRGQAIALERNYRFKSHEEYLVELAKLFFVEYDSGYGIQHLYGFVVFSDGTYIDREEYDGSEWWQEHIRPSIDEVDKEERI